MQICKICCRYKVYLCSCINNIYKITHMCKPTCMCVLCFHFLFSSTDFLLHSGLCHLTPKPRTEPGQQEVCRKIRGISVSD